MKLALFDIASETFILENVCQTTAYCTSMCGMCQETAPSMETGDLCADTAPTPKSKACQDPGDVNDICGVTKYQDTPYNNYMSYTGTVEDLSLREVS